MIPQRLHGHVDHGTDMRDHSCVRNDHVEPADLVLDARNSGFMGRLVPELQLEEANFSRGSVSKSLKIKRGVELASGGIDHHVWTDGEQAHEGEAYRATFGYKWQWLSLGSTHQARGSFQ